MEGFLDGLACTGTLCHVLSIGKNTDKEDTMQEGRQRSGFFIDQYF